MPARYTRAISTRDLDVEPSPVAISRRQWLFGAGGLICGATITGAVAFGAMRAMRAAPAGVPAPVPAAGRAPWPDWYQEMLRLAPERLVERAGEYERHSWRHFGEARLAPGFERLLDAVLASAHELRDVAGQCAMRSLDRLGCPDLVAAWLRRVERDRALQGTAGEARRVLDERRPPRERENR